MPEGNNPITYLRELIPVDDLADLYLDAADLHGSEAVQSALAYVAGWGTGGSVDDNSRRGVLVALGIEPDRFGGYRTLIRRYRAAQFRGALETLGVAGLPSPEPVALGVAA